MQSFLDLCAEHLIRIYSQDLKKTCVILPTRRSGLVLKNLMMSKKTQVLPEILPIESFMTNLSGLEKTSPVMLILELYDIFRQIDPKIRLEKFTGWGFILIKDFDQIDRNLVDAQQLFQNLSDIKNIERWNIHREQITPRIDEYFQLWENLHQTYLQFRERLWSQQQAYSGMMYRYLAENASTKLLNDPNFEKYVFIGFNALSKAEEKIFKTLYDHKKAEIIWDADAYYMQGNVENKAGLFLRKYQKNWVSTNWKFQSNHLLNSEKDIQVIRVANASMQGGVVNQLLRNWTILPKTQETALIISDTAVVLADEHLLRPVLFALDEPFTDLNISLGLALKDSALFNLVDVLFEQHQTHWVDKETSTIKFSHRSVIKLLNHPFIRQFEKRHCPPPENTQGSAENRSLILLLIHFINKNNLIYISQDELLTMVASEPFQERLREEEGLLYYCEEAIGILTPLFQLLFHKWKNTFDVIRILEGLTELLASPDYYLEGVHFQEFKKILGQLKGFVNHRPKFIDIRTFKIFLYQAFRETKFDFDSERDHPIQLMGIVETRNLDFENVVILSVNETVLPRSRRLHSFIPVDISRAFELPSYTEQDAVISYHFYRLLQRAKKITLVYVSPSDTYGGKEKSRFIHQLENDLAKQNPKVSIQEKPAQFQIRAEEPEKELIIPKDAKALAKMKANFKEGLSPSHINSFIKCSLQYYFSHIAEIGAPSSVEETLGADKLGSLIHEILEDIFRELCQNTNVIHAADLEAVLPSIEPRVNQKFQLDKYANYIITGQNYIVKQVTSQYLEKFIRSQIQEIKEQNQPFEILSLETWETGEKEKAFSPTLSAKLKLPLGEEVIELALKGITDRIDKVQNVVRIIDYKTGKVENRNVNPKFLDQEYLIQEPKGDKVRQLWLYKYMIAKRILQEGNFQLSNYTLDQQQAITAGIYSLRNLEAGLLELKAAKDKAALFPENLAEYVKTSEQYLRQIIENMLNPQQDFEKTADKETCQYCAYKEICGRG